MHALAAAYAEGAEGRHEVRRIELATLDFPLLRTRQEWTENEPPPGIAAAQEAIRWAEHIVIIFPLWLGDMPAKLKGMLEQTARPGFALRYGKGFPEGLLKGRSARIVATMGMPALLYRLYYRAHAVKLLERNILRFAGMQPVRTSLIGGVEGSPAGRKRWLERMREYGREAR